MRDVVRRVAATAPQPMVLDADALNALATDAPSVLVQATAPRVLTPHPGEMGRLSGASTAAVQADRLGHATRLAAATRAIVVLKGARTIIAAPDGASYVSPIACAALATAGSGDVLAGVIGALLARGCDALTAAQIGVYVHGAAGVDLEASLGDGVAAGDLPQAIAAVMARLQRGEASGSAARSTAAPAGKPWTRIAPSASVFAQTTTPPAAVTVTQRPTTSLPSVAASRAAVHAPSRDAEPTASAARAFAPTGPSSAAAAAASASLASLLPRADHAAAARISGGSARAWTRDASQTPPPARLRDRGTQAGARGGIGARRTPARASGARRQGRGAPRAHRRRRARSRRRRRSPPAGRG